MALVPVVGARLVAWDSRSSLVALNSLTPVLYLPAWAVAVGALAGRRFRLLAGAVLVVVVCHAGLVLPELTASTSTPPAARSAPSFRLFDANVFAGNTDVAGFAEELRRRRPDVVMLQESTPAFLAALEETGVLGDLPHRVVASRTDPFGAMLASRWPLRGEEVLYANGRPSYAPPPTSPAARSGCTRCTSSPPFGGNRDPWVAEIGMVREAVRAERRPVLMAGDFNATWGHRAFRRLLDAGMTDAAAARGRAMDMTWPRNLPLVPAATRIDHVLTTTGVFVTGIGTGRGRGSDHRPLVAEVAVT